MMSPQMIYRIYTVMYIIVYYEYQTSVEHNRGYWRVYVAAGWVNIATLSSICHQLSLQMPLQVGGEKETVQKEQSLISLAAPHRPII